MSRLSIFNRGRKIITERLWVIYLPVEDHRFYLTPNQDWGMWSWDNSTTYKAIISRHRWLGMLPTGMIANVLLITIMGTSHYCRIDAVIA